LKKGINKQRNKGRKENKRMEENETKTESVKTTGNKVR
jgi:hypothetical protein